MDPCVAPDDCDDNVDVTAWIVSHQARITAIGAAIQAVVAKQREGM